MDQEGFLEVPGDFQAAQEDFRVDLVGFQAAQADSLEDQVDSQAVPVEFPAAHQEEARQEGRHRPRRQPSCRRNRQQPLQLTQAESADACSDSLIFG
ncbi:hypothetical protein METH109765_08285 [Mesobacillus thioparans]